MKKLFYIILVVIVLLVISKFVKNEAPISANTAEPAAVEETVNTEEISNMVVEPADSDNLSDGEVVEDGVIEEVEEVNPDQTADEDETIIAE